MGFIFKNIEVFLKSRIPQWCSWTEWGRATLSADMISNWEKTLGLWSTFCNRAASTFHVNCHFSLFLVQNKFAFLVLWTLLSRSRSFSICTSIVLFSSEEWINRMAIFIIRKQVGQKFCSSLLELFVWENYGNCDAPILLKSGERGWAKRAGAEAGQPGLAGSSQPISLESRYVSNILQRVRKILIAFHIFVINLIWIPRYEH